MVVVKDCGPNDAKNYDEFIKNSKLPSFVKFFSPGCGHCIAMADAWLALKDNEEVKKCDVNIIAIDAGAVSKIENDSAKGVNGYPTIRELMPGGEVGEEYSGERTTEAMKDFVKEIHGKAANSKKKKSKTMGGASRRKRSMKRGTKRGTKRDRKNKRRIMTKRKRAL